MELGEGIAATCKLPKAAAEAESSSSTAKADLSSLSAMLSSKWKSGASPSGSSKPEAIAAGQIRSFRITGIDPNTKKVEVELKQ